MDVINTKECLNCGKDLHNLPKKRKKVFCNNTCRSNYWQKSDRLEKQGKSIEEIVSTLNKQMKEAVKLRNLNKPTGTKEVEKKAAKNESIDTTLGEALQGAQLKAYEDELERLKPLNETTLTKRRIQFLNTQISKLKK
jgi:hypothetical protein